MQFLILIALVVLICILVPAAVWGFFGGLTALFLSTVLGLLGTMFFLDTFSTLFRSKDLRDFSPGTNFILAIVCGGLLYLCCRWHFVWAVTGATWGVFCLLAFIYLTSGKSTPSKP